MTNYSAPVDRDGAIEVPMWLLPNTCRNGLGWSPIRKVSRIRTDKSASVSLSRADHAPSGRNPSPAIGKIQLRSARPIGSCGIALCVYGDSDLLSAPLVFTQGWMEDRGKRNSILKRVSRGVRWGFLGLVSGLLSCTYGLAWNGVRAGSPPPDVPLGRR